MAKKSKLLAALDAHKGRDYEAEKKKKQVKAAERRKRQKREALEKSAGVGSDEDDLGVEVPAVTPVQSTESKVDDFADFSSSDDEDEHREGAGVHLASGNGSIPQPDVEPSASEADPESDVPLSDLSEDDRADTIPHQRLTINNGPALLASRNRVAIVRPKMQFHAHNSLISTLPPASDSVPDPNDDLTRELEFYRIARTAAMDARSLLKKEGIPFERPNDYFAEMVKSDEHMGKVKKKMYDEAASKKASGEARAQREARKFGKKVQIAKEQERAKEKRDTLDKIKDLKRKRKGQDTGKVNEDNDLFQSIDVEDGPQKDSQGRERGQGPNFKRQKRDSKFGFGGKKRFAKSGDAASSADIRGFSAGGMKGRRGGGSGSGTKRLGKSRRTATR